MVELQLKIEMKGSEETVTQYLTFIGRMMEPEF